MLPSSSTVITQPISLKQILPSATLRPLGPVPEVANNANIALPRFAPSTRNKAIFKPIRPLAANAAVRSTTARLDQNAIANTAPTSISRTGSPEIEARMIFTPGASDKGRAAFMIICSASRINPTPMATLPIWPVRVPLRDKCSTTPMPINNGASQERSKENTCTTRLVPTSAPSMIASAGVSGINRWLTNDAVMTAVAEEDCTRLVTPSPARKAWNLFATLADRTRRRFAPKTRNTPLRTMCVPHTSRATPERILMSVCIGVYSVLERTAVTMAMSRSSCW